MSLTSHAKSNAGGPCRAQKDSAVLGVQFWSLKNKTILFGTSTSFRKALSQNVFFGAGTNWAFFWRIRVLRLCERISSVAGNAVINAGLGKLSQVDSEFSNGLQCSQGFRNQARSGAPETRLHSFPMVARQSEQGRVECGESWHNRPIG